MDPKKIIGIIAVAAAAATGYVPGVPALIGAPSDDAAAALPAAPPVADMPNTFTVEPDDDLTRLIVRPSSDDTVVAIAEPTPIPESEATPTPVLEPPPTAELEAEPTPEPSATVQPEVAIPASEGPTPTPHPIDAASLESLTIGAELEFDEQGRPWAVFPDGTRAPLFSSADAVAPTVRPVTPTATPPPAKPAPDESAVPGIIETRAALTDGVLMPEAMPSASLGHPTIDVLAGMDGVESVVSLGDGSFLATVEDRSVLEGLPLTVAEDTPMLVLGDSYQPYQWALDNDGSVLAGTDAEAPQLVDADINVHAAWPVSAGAGSVVAVIDTGVDFTHPDLIRAEWYNPGEDCLNRIDDDQNGYVDDCRGWDFAYHDKVPSNEGMHPHATHLAGVIAGSVNGSGIVGAAPAAKIMNLNVAHTTITGDPAIGVSAVALAVRYAVDNDADVINLSLGTPPGTPREAVAPLESAIAYAEEHGVLVVAPAGNDGLNIDDEPVWPASLPYSNVITVGASTPSDTLAEFSNWGRSVDILAPGEMILGPVPLNDDGFYAFMSGTSQSAALTSATVALMASQSRTLPADDARSRLIDGAERSASLDETIRNGLRLSAAGALGLDTLRHRIDDVQIAISGLDELRPDVEGELDLDIAVPLGHFDQHHVWWASLFAKQDGDTLALFDHEVRVGRATKNTDKFGAVELGFTGSGKVTIATALPAGDYVLVLEAVTWNEQEERFREPKSVAFTVADGPPVPAEEFEVVPSQRSMDPVQVGNWRINALFPAEGPQGSAVPVKIKGNFPEPVYVWFGDRAGTVLSQTVDVIEVLPPQRMTTGSVAVRLHQSSPLPLVEMNDGYRYLEADGVAGLPELEMFTDLPLPKAAPAPVVDVAGPPAEEGEGGDVEGSDPDDAAGDESDEDGAEPVAPPTPRQPRLEIQPGRVDLSGGLIAMRVDAHDPTSGATSCSTEPCRMS